MSPRPGRLVTAALACSLASFATAALAHVLIGAFAPEAGTDAYGSRAHVALGPVALAAALVLAGGLLRVAASALARRDGADPIVALARALGARRFVPSFALVALGGVAALVTMESVEQVAAYGRLAGAADTLGGNVAVGLAIVLLCAAAITIAGLRFARLVVDAAIAGSRALVAWIATLVRRLDAAPRHASAAGPVPAPIALLFLARCSGLRAPPLPPVVLSHD